MESKEEYRRCTKTVMDNIADPDIYFDEEGVSNYWHDYQNIYSREIVHGDEGKKLLEEQMSAIKHAGKGKQYDCIVGLSGGVDSTYIAYLIKQHDLRPLAIHFDNGWNSKIANENIRRIIDYLKCDLYTLVVDWEEFKDLQLSFMKASVIDIEQLTDHAIFGTLYKQAVKHNISYVVSGANMATESILPKSWIFNKLDGVNIKDIHSKFGKIPLKTYPLFTGLSKRFYLKFKKTKFVYPLNYIDYNKEEAKQVISREIGWKDYGGKHFESIFTRFYQAYILPRKFNVDKRKAHLSTLICSGQITRDEALEELKKPAYDPEQEKKDKVFVIKKLGLTEEEFEWLMNQGPISHQHYKTEGPVEEQYPFIKPIKQLYRKLSGSN